jgi:hypothetical protein
MERKLELKDIAGYLPHRLNIWIPGGTDEVGMLDRYGIVFNADKTDRYSLGFYKPILHPHSDLYRPVMHNGKEVVHIVELARLHNPKLLWKHNGATAINELYEFGYDYDFGFFCYFGSLKCHINNQYQLFDYLHELKIDYRGLIDVGLAVDCNALEDNPYK